MAEEDYAIQEALNSTFATFYSTNAIVNACTYESQSPTFMNSLSFLRLLNMSLTGTPTSVTMRPKASPTTAVAYSLGMAAGACDARWRQMADSLSNVPLLPC